MQIGRTNQIKYRCVMGWINGIYIYIVQFKSITKYHRCILNAQNF